MSSFSFSGCSTTYSSGSMIISLGDCISASKDCILQRIIVSRGINREWPRLNPRVGRAQGIVHSLFALRVGGRIGSCSPDSWSPPKARLPSQRSLKIAFGGEEG
jgi:hypothetical protein